MSIAKYINFRSLDFQFLRGQPHIDTHRDASNKQYLPSWRTGNKYSSCVDWNRTEVAKRNRVIHRRSQLFVCGVHFFHQKKLTTLLLVALNQHDLKPLNQPLPPPNLQNVLKIDSCSAWVHLVCSGAALTNFPCQLRLKKFLLPGVQVHPLHPWPRLWSDFRSWCINKFFSCLPNTSRYYVNCQFGCKTAPLARFHGHFPRLPLLKRKNLRSLSLTLTLNWYHWHQGENIPDNDYFTRLTFEIPSKHIRRLVCLIVITTQNEKIHFALLK